MAPKNRRSARAHPTAGSTPPENQSGQSASSSEGSSAAHDTEEGASGAASTSDADTEHGVLSALLDEGAPDASTSAPTGSGRRGRGPAWRGGELSALIVAMDAHGVFLPNKSTQDRHQAWDRVAEDVNRWAEEAEDAKNANRSQLACENQWRKVVFKKFQEGKKMSEIATGTAEDTDEEWQPIITSLAEQWDELCTQDTARKEGKNTAAEERKKGPRAAAAAAERLGEEEGVDDDDDEDDVQTSSTKARTKPTGSSLLASTMGSFVTEQARSAEAERKLRAAQHEATMAEAREAREEQQRQHREALRLKERELDMEVERTRKDTQLEHRLDRLDNSLGELVGLMKKNIPK